MLAMASLSRPPMLTVGHPGRIHSTTPLQSHNNTVTASPVDITGVTSNSNLNSSILTKEAEVTEATILAEATVGEEALPIGDTTSRWEVVAITMLVLLSSCRSKIFSS